MHTDALWEEYKAWPTLGTRNLLLEEYRWLAQQTANAMTRQMNPTDREDALAAAVLSLLRAVQDWDPALTPDFERFARFKVRAGIVDWLRSVGWVGKSTRQQARRLQEAEVALLAMNMGRRPTEAEIAEHLGLRDADELAALRSRVGSTAWEVASLDAPPAGEAVGSWHESIADAERLGPEEEMLGAARTAALESIMERLPVRHREVLRARLWRGEPQKQTARRLGIHESRASQIWTEAVLRCRSLAHQRPLDIPTC